MLRIRTGARLMLRLRSPQEAGATNDDTECRKFSSQGRNRMSSVITSFVIASLLVLPASTLAGQRSVPAAPGSSQTAPAVPPYFPDRFDWQHKKPEEVGMDAARLDQAVKQAVASENPATKEMTLFLATTFVASETFRPPIGPVKDRGGANGS